MRKENKNPNKSEQLVLRTFQQDHGKARQRSRQPDSSTSRNSSFHPRYIIKDVPKEEQPRMTMKESNEQSHTFINSPVSLTEKNTLQIDQIALNNERINYRDKFTRVSAELERRTERFNQVIDLCSRVLGSIKSENDNYSSTYVHKIGYANAKIEDMLQAFDMFRLGL